MAGKNEAGAASSRQAWRVLWIAVAAGAALFFIFHRPILLAIERQAVLHYAARHNLKADFRLEGNPFGRLTIQNLRAVAAGPSSIESIDIARLTLDLSPIGLVRHGLARLFNEVDARSVRIVLDPANKPPSSPRKSVKLQLPKFFPGRVQLRDVTLVIRSAPRDFVLENVDLDLNPFAVGELRIAKLQLPGGRRWSDIVGRTSYTRKNLIVRDLALGKDAQIRFLNIDASRIESRALSLKLDGSAGGGSLLLSARVAETAASLDLDAHAEARHISADSLNEFLLPVGGDLSGEIESLSLGARGVIHQPKTWTGALSLRLNGVQQAHIRFDHAALELSAAEGKATLRSAEMIQDGNEFRFRGNMELPDTLSGFGRAPARLEISGKAADLARLTSGFGVGLTGTAEFTGKIDIAGAKLEGNLTVIGRSISFQDGGAETINVTLHAAKALNHERRAKPWFADLRAAMQLDLTNVRYGGCLLDSVQGTLTSLDDAFGLDRLEARRNQNQITVRGRYRLPAEVGKAASQPAEVEFALRAPETGDFWTPDFPSRLSGVLEAHGQIKWENQLADGELSLFGSNLGMRGLVFRQINSQCSIANSVVYLNDCSASLNDADSFHATGRLDLRRPFAYGGKIAANVANLATLQPLLRAFGNPNELGGSLTLNWEGEGNTQIARSSGHLKLALQQGRYGSFRSVQANVQATYSPEGLDAPTIFIATGKTILQAIVYARNGMLEIDKLQLDQGGASFASGYVSLPFVWRNLGTKSAIIPLSGKIGALIQSENLDLKKLCDDFGIKPAISGMVSSKLEADGTINRLQARLEAQARNVRNEQWPKMEPATFQLSAQVADNRLSAWGKLQQARIQPMELNASMPFDLPQMIRAGALPLETPITASARLPRTSVNFVRQFVPALQQLDGDLALDVNVGGTISRPLMSGTGEMTVNTARFTNATLPALTNFRAQVSFARDALTLDRFGGELAGGPFRMTGRIAFPKLTEPTLDLQFKAESVLLARNDTLTARADADLKITGPLATATATGDVALTNSHILKNIDLIPIGLPGRPAPQPPSARPEFSIDTPPFRDWQFQIAIKTKDPVLIRGNLATGQAVGNLTLRGTGLQPALQGVVQMRNLEATLPFSRLNVSRCLLTFDPGDPLNPQIDLEGQSVIRDYTVRVYVYGRVRSPQAIFTSEPPLAQEEIISLIATGATRRELSGTNVLAGRAASLLVQQLYRKIFKQGEPAQGNTFFDRLDLDVGTIDPRTGQQQVTATYRINDQLVLTGDVGIRGDFRGRLKYLIRFR